MVGDGACELEEDSAAEVVTEASNVTELLEDASELVVGVSTTLFVDGPDTMSSK